jgi:hypothetical protein
VSDSTERLSDQAALASAAVAGIGRHLKPVNPGLTSGLPRVMEGHLTKEAASVPRGTQIRAE